MTIEMSIVISIITAIVAIIGAMTIYKKEVKVEGEINARTNEKLNYITKSVDDIKKDLKIQADKLETITEQVIRMDEKNKK